MVGRMLQDASVDFLLESLLSGTVRSVLGNVDFTSLPPSQQELCISNVVISTQEHHFDACFLPLTRSSLPPTIKLPPDDALLPQILHGQFLAWQPHAAGMARGHDPPPSVGTATPTAWGMLSTSSAHVRRDPPTLRHI
jgi:hypothetical protein